MSDSVQKKDNQTLSAEPEKTPEASAKAADGAPASELTSSFESTTTPEPTSTPAPEPDKASQRKASHRESGTRRLIYRICLTAMFLAFAIVAKMLLPINITIFGAGGMKVSMAGVFTAFPAFLFGPLYGGAASALSDLLGYIIRPDGAYIPWLTLTAFAGGCIKGLLWRLLTGRKSAGLRAGVAALLVLLGVLGVSTHISLFSDGIISDVITKQTAVPNKGIVTTTELSPLSKLACDSASYNNDTFTLLGIEDGSEAVVPSYVILDGYKTKLAKVGADAFAVNTAMKKLYVPATVTTFDEGAFGELDVKSLTIVTPEGSKTAAAAEKLGIKVEIGDVEEITVDLDPATFEGGGIRVRSSDTYRKYLSGYINFMTAGLEFVSLLGLLLLAVDLIIRRTEKKNVRGSNLLRIFVSITTAGMVVTTINTEILRHVLTAWNDRAFIILWIPRAAEELIVCMFQAYVISLLYGVYLTRIKRTPSAEAVPETTGEDNRNDKK
ncbi:MAG: folate family ECF transporter S component [Clostridiales bacterium]|nr:folate family ECF transporter S component [Clostridiales bacterium]